jgi:hypothetical protein
MTDLSIVVLGQENGGGYQGEGVVRVHWRHVELQPLTAALDLNRW